MDIVLILLNVADWILAILQWILFAWVILSWILYFAHNSQLRWRHRRLYQNLEKINAVLERVMRPLLRPFRRLLRRFNTGPWDLSPLLLMVLIYVLRRQILWWMSQRILHASF